MAHTTVIQDQLLLLLKSAHLQRLARFALIDEVPSPWGLRAKRSDGSAAAADSSEDR
jgi:hypothetical protein